MANFLVGRLLNSSQIWACVDASLCTAPAVANRRFEAYLTPFPSEHEARQAMMDAGCDRNSIAPELRSTK